MTQMSKFFHPTLSSMPLCIPRYYGGVILVGCGAIGLNVYFSKRVMVARKEHNVEYPLLYHPTNNTFNCIQRGHQNYLETLPLFLMVLLVGGLRYPRTYSICGTIVLIGRVLYFKGYSTGDPKKRKWGAVGFLGLLPMVLGFLAFGAQHLLASIENGSSCHSCA